MSEVKLLEAILLIVEGCIMSPVRAKETKEWAAIQCSLSEGF